MTICILFVVDTYNLNNSHAAAAYNITFDPLLSESEVNYLPLSLPTLLWREFLP